MDAVQRVLPSTSFIASEKSAKDTKHKKYLQSKNWPVFDDENKQVAGDNSNALEQAIETVELERRAGADRRLSAKKRGRWLESREKNDRRTPINISLKI